MVLEAKLNLDLMGMIEEWGRCCPRFGQAMGMVNKL